MSGNKLFVDTNIGLYLLSGDEVLSAVLDHKELYVSVISEMELLAYPNISEAETARIRLFLEDCQLVDLNQAIKQLAIDTRKKHRLKLPDAIVAASALHLNIPLISADSIFNRIDELHFVHYEL